MDLTDNFICFGRLKEIPTSFFDDYYFKRPKLALYFFYNYEKLITVVESTPKIEGNIFFDHNHLHPKKKFNDFWKQNPTFH